MEFLSPKTKARIDQLEQENTQLKSALAERQVKNTTSVAWFPWVLVVIGFAGAVFFALRGNGPSESEIAQMQVQMWREGVAIDTVFKPNSGIEFSVQVGAYNNLNISDLSYGLEQLSVRGDSGAFKVVLGSYSSLPDAQSFLELVVKLGFDNAFIVAYEGDNAVGLLPNKTALN